MNKKFIYIIVGIVMILLISIIIIDIFTAKPVNLIAKPTEDKLNMPFLTQDTKSLYYFDGNTTLKKWNLTTNKTEEWIKFPFTNTDLISYSPDGNKALVYWRDPISDNKAHRIWLIDLENKKILKEISQNIYANTWSPDSQSIAYQTYNEGVGQFELDIATFNNTNIRRIALVSPDYDSYGILWPSKNTLIYFPKPQEMAAVDIKSVDLTNLQTKSIMTQVRVEDASIAIDQNKILVNLFDSTGEITNLNIFDLTTQENQTTNVKNLYIYKTTQIANTDKFYAGLRQGDQTADGIIRFDLKGKVEVIKKSLLKEIDTEYLMSLSEKNLYFLSGNQLYNMKTNL